MRAHINDLESLLTWSNSFFPPCGIPLKKITKE